MPNIFVLYTYGKTLLPFTQNTKLAYLEEETYIYSTHIRAILNGYWTGDPYVWEYRQSPSPFLGEIGSLIPIVILSAITGSVRSAFILSDVLFPMSLVLIIYIGLIKNGHQRLFSLTASLVVLLTPYTSMLLPRLASFGTDITGDSNNMLFFSRTPHPQMSSIYLFGVVFLTAIILSKPKSKIIYLWSLLLGVSIYSTPFITSTIFIAIILISPLLIIKVPKKNLIFSAVIVILMALPFIINLINLREFLAQSDFLTRTTFPTELLFPNQMRFIVFGVILFLLRKDYLSRIVTVHIIAAGFLVDGHQLISGRNLEADHWISRVLSPLSTLALMLIAQNLYHRFHLKNRPYLLPAIILIVITIAFTKQLRWVEVRAYELQPDIPYEHLVNEINTKTQKDDVIGSLDYKISRHLTGLTGRRTYIAPGDRTFVTSREQTERLCNLFLMSQNLPNNTIERGLISYAYGFSAWYNIDVSHIVNDLESCIEEKVITKKYKIDYLIEKNNLTGQWELIPIMHDTF